MSQFVQCKYKTADVAEAESYFFIYLREFLTEKVLNRSNSAVLSIQKSCNLLETLDPSNMMAKTTSDFSGGRILPFNHIC